MKKKITMAPSASVQRKRIYRNKARRKTNKVSLIPNLKSKFNPIKRALTSLMCCLDFFYFNERNVQ